jgi:NAD(P)-dependent dehydrogenase (short-subunit alcohol dehydrogenase family)
MTLKDRTVVIFGGSSGIGLATAKAAATEGAGVVEFRLGRIGKTLPDQR